MANVTIHSLENNREIYIKDKDFYLTIHTELH